MPKAALQNSGTRCVASENIRGTTSGSVATFKGVPQAAPPVGPPPPASLSAELDAMRQTRGQHLAGSRSQPRRVVGSPRIVRRQTPMFIQVPGHGCPNLRTGRGILLANSRALQAIPTCRNLPCGPRHAESHGHGRAVRLMLGSAACAVALHAPYSVEVVRVPATEAERAA